MLTCGTRRDMSQVKISLRIKEARKKLGLTQSQAAEAWGFNFGTIRAWEEERRNPFGLYREKLEKTLKDIDS